MTSLITILAFILDWLIGDPQTWPHPVRHIGRFITSGEKKALKWAGGEKAEPEKLVWAGVWLVAATVGAAMLTVTIILWLAAMISGLLWFAAALYLVYSAFCLKDLYYQTWQVEKALRNGFIDEARQKLSWVVGRDTAPLDEKGIRRALIETLAENFADGLAAPMFYLAIGGPVLTWGYKAVNTLDSMIGYKNDRYMYLGRFAARLDDVANYVPARLASFFLIVSARLQGHDWWRGFKVWFRDARLHTSPNSGHPEAAMSGILGIWLGGDHYYQGRLCHKPVIGAEGGEVTPDQVLAAENIVVGASLLLLGVAVALILLGVGIGGWF